MLANCGRDLLLSWVSDKVVLQEWIDHEDWLQVMNILSFHALGPDVDLRTNRSLSNLGELSLHIVGEGSELLDVDAPSGLDVVLDILDERFPDDQHLSFRLKRLEVRRCSLSRLIVLSWVLVSVLQDPVSIERLLEIDLHEESEGKGPRLERESRRKGEEMTYQSMTLSISILLFKLL